METKMIMLTPDMAKGFLESVDDRQRKLSLGAAATIARDIESGKWNEDYARIDIPIAISKEGKLLNGQHRCKAAVIANKAILVPIAYGVDSELFEYMDNAKSRSAVQFIGGKDSKTVSALAGFALCIEHSDNSLRVAINRPNMGSAGRSTRVNASRTELIAYVESNRDLLDFCVRQGNRIYAAFNRAGNGKSAICCALWLLIYLGLADRADIFSYADEIVSSQPESKVIAFGKTLGLKKIIFAQKEGVKIDRRFWVALILEMFDKRESAKTFKGNVFIEKTIDKFSALLDVKRGLEPK